MMHHLSIKNIIVYFLRDFNVKSKINHIDIIWILFLKIKSWCFFDMKCNLTITFISLLIVI